MPSIYDRDLASSKLRDAVASIARHKLQKIGRIEEELSAIFGIEPRTLRSWKTPANMPGTIEDSAFFAFIYLALTEGKMDLLWLDGLLEATSVPVFRPITANLLTAYIEQARFSGKVLNAEEVTTVVNTLFTFKQANGIEGLLDGNTGSAIQTLIPLEPEHRDYIRGSADISIVGITLYRFLEAFFHDFVYALRHEARLRIILVEPNDCTLGMITYRSVSGASREVQHQRIESTISTIKRMKHLSKSKQISLKVLNYIPPYGITIYHAPNHPLRPICQARLFTFKTPTPEAPTLLMSEESNDGWFAFFQSQFELMWEYAAAYPLGE